MPNRLFTLFANPFNLSVSKICKMVVRLCVQFMFPHFEVFFYAREYEGYTGRNPKTGEAVEIAPKKLPYCKCGKGLRERVDK